MISLAEHATVAIEALAGNRLRSMLTMLGVVIGVAAVILLVALGEGTRRYVEDQFSGLGANILIVTPGKTETRGGHPEMGATKYKLTLEDSNRLSRRTDMFAGVAPVVFGTAEVRLGGKTRDVRILGINPDFETVRNLRVEIGSFVTQADVDATRRVCILGRTVRTELFGNANPLGKTVKIAESRFRVVGVMEKKGVSLGMDLDDLVFVPVTTAMEIFDTDALIEIVLAARGKERIGAAKRETRDILFRSHNRHEDFTVTDQAAMLSSLFSILDTLTYVLAGIAAISLLVGGIGIMNIMLVSVKERTNEIGIRKAVGARDRDILGQFLLEATILSTTGGLCGIAFGVLVLGLLSTIFPKLPVAVPMWSVVLAFTFSVAVGIFFGVYPARKAAAQNPIEALRYE